MERRPAIDKPSQETLSAHVRVNATDWRAAIEILDRYLAGDGPQNLAGFRRHLKAQISLADAQFILPQHVRKGGIEAEVCRAIHNGFDTRAKLDEMFRRDMHANVYNLVRKGAVWDYGDKLSLPSAGDAPPAAEAKQHAKNGMVTSAVREWITAYEALNPGKKPTSGECVSALGAEGLNELSVGVTFRKQMAAQRPAGDGTEHRDGHTPVVTYAQKSDINKDPYWLRVFSAHGLLGTMLAADVPYAVGHAPQLETIFRRLLSPTNVSSEEELQRAAIEIHGATELMRRSQAGGEVPKPIREGIVYLFSLSRDYRIAVFDPHMPYTKAAVLLNNILGQPSYRARTIFEQHGVRL